jgi:hypothetical protein
MILLFFVLPMMTVDMSAQSTINKLNRSSIGYNLIQIQNDFGLGLDFVSPYFMNKNIALKIGFNVQWLEHTSKMIATTTEWTPYCNIRTGIRCKQFIFDNKMGVYGEGGIISLLPNKKFSNEKICIGGYGLFGFEFNPSFRSGLFIEFGGVGTGATANKIVFKPIYSNGFMTNVGFRYYL